MQLCVALVAGGFRKNILGSVDVLRLHHGLTDLLTSRIQKAIDKSSQIFEHK